MIFGKKTVRGIVVLCCVAACFGVILMVLGMGQTPHVCTYEAHAQGCHLKYDYFPDLFMLISGYLLFVVPLTGLVLCSTKSWFVL